MNALGWPVWGSFSLRLESFLTQEKLDGTELPLNGKGATGRYAAVTPGQMPPPFVVGPQPKNCKFVPFKIGPIPRIALVSRFFEERLGFFFEKVTHEV